MRFAAYSRRIGCSSAYCQTEGDLGREQFTFDKEQIAAANEAHDLVLTLPRVKPDIREGRISLASGEAVPLILLNGVHSSDEELKTVPPSKVIRVDYYDLPPLRYNTTRAVIDVITKPLDNGHSGGFSFSTAPLATDVYGRLFYGYNWGRHRISLFTHPFYRKLRKGREINETLYYTADKAYRVSSSSVEQFISKNIDLKATYTYTNPSINTFQASLSGNYEDFLSKADIALHAEAARKTDERKGEMEAASHSFSPVADIYYDHRFAGDARLSANLVVTHNIVGQQAHNLEQGSASPALVYFDDKLKADNRKTSLLTQVEYAHPFRLFLLRLGGVGMYSDASFEIEGSSLGEIVKDNQKQYRQRLYISLEGSAGKFSYQVLPELSLLYASAHYGQPLSQTLLYFTPKAYLFYRLPANQTLRLELEAANNLPSLSMTTSVMRQVREGYYQRNNPNLRNSYDFRVQLRHSYGNKYIDLVSKAYLSYSKDVFFTAFVHEGRALVGLIDNAKYQMQSGGEVELSYKPLGNEMLILRALSAPFYQRYCYTEQMKEGLFAIPFRAYIQYQYKGFGLQFDYVAPYKKLMNYFVSYSNWAAEVGASYQYRNWDFGLSIENLFVEERYSSQNIPAILLQGASNTRVRDNFWKVGMSVSYYFSVGKEYKAAITLENEDPDTVKLQ